MAEVKLNGAKTLSTMAEMFCNGEDRTEFILVADADDDTAQVITHCSRNFMLNALHGIMQTAFMSMKEEGADKASMMMMSAMVGAKAMAAVWGEDEEEEE